MQNSTQEWRQTNPPSLLPALLLKRDKSEKKLAMYQPNENTSFGLGCCIFPVKTTKMQFAGEENQSPPQLPLDRKGTRRDCKYLSPYIDTYRRARTVPLHAAEQQKDASPQVRWESGAGGPGQSCGHRWVPQPESLLGRPQTGPGGPVGYGPLGVSPPPAPRAC